MALLNYFFLLCKWLRCLVTKHEVLREIWFPRQLHPLHPIPLPSLTAQLFSYCGKNMYSIT